MKRLTDDSVRDLIRMEDPLGVLSVYVGIPPERATEPQPGWPIEIRNQLRDLRQRIREEDAHERWNALDKLIADIDPDLERLLDAARHGRGRALFAAASDGWVDTVAIQIPFRDRVVFDRNPYVRPLVAAVDEGRGAGIVVVHKRGVRVLEWHMGEAEELTNEEFSIGGREWKDKTGPAPAQPLDTRVGGHKRDMFEDRVMENRLRFIRELARKVAESANERGWDRLIVSGDPRWTKPFAEELHPASGEQLHVTDLSWEDESPNAIAGEALEMFKDLRRERAVSLVEDARDRALGGGTGGLGVTEVVSSLNQGRVDHLLFDAEVTLAGHRSEDGMLFTDELLPTAGGAAVPEPYLVERMIDRAVETRAKITPVEDDAAEMLRAHGGVAALLRW